MRILAITHVFPDAFHPYCGIFAARQFAALSRCGAAVTVVSATIKIPRVLGLFRKEWKNYFEKKHEPQTYNDLNVRRISYVRLTRGGWPLGWDGLGAVLRHQEMGT